MSVFRDWHRTKSEPNSPLPQEAGQSSPHRALVLLAQRGLSPERVDAVHGHEEPERATVTLLLELPQHHSHGITGTPDTGQTLQGAQDTQLSLHFLPGAGAGDFWAALPRGKNKRTVNNLFVPFQGAA